VAETEQHFYAHGKLLLSGEYFVLDGAKALALPTRFGQHLDVRQADSSKGWLFWESLDDKGNTLLSATFELKDFGILERTGEVPHYLLQDTLRAARNLRNDFLIQAVHINAVSRLEFSIGWGLGSSSTLIQNIASWARVDAFDLFFSVLEGSGYDIACATANHPIVYQLKNSRVVWNEIESIPLPLKNTVFVYLGKKQNSQQAVRQYRDNDHDPGLIKQISLITEKMISAKSTDEFISLMKRHEDILASALRLEKVQDAYFSDFPGAVKSLGAWGGDFVMALAENASFPAKKYFEEKGYPLHFSFEEIRFKMTQ